MGRFIKMTTHTLVYAGVGSRRTPENILQDMTFIAKKLEEKGYDLRSGGADGADKAFEAGAGVQKQIFVPWDGFNGIKQLYKIPDKAFEIAQQNHPAWNNLSQAIKCLMARNVQQVLGAYLQQPCEFVICWTPDGAFHDKQRSMVTGGTGLAISVASKNGIPVFNIKRKVHHDFVMKRLLVSETALQNYLD